LQAQVDVHFGRARYFIIYDLETGAWEAAENPAAQEARGAGIAAATFLVERGVEAVITGHCGPKAFAVLDAAGVKVASVPGGRVEEVLAKLRAGELSFISSPNAEAHFGGGIPALGKIIGGGRGRGCRHRGGPGQGRGRACKKGNSGGGK